MVVVAKFTAEELQGQFDLVLRNYACSVKIDEFEQVTDILILHRVHLQKNIAILCHPL